MIFAIIFEAAADCLRRNCRFRAFNKKMMQPGAVHCRGFETSGVSLHLMDSVGDPADDDLAAVDQSSELQDDWSLHKGTPPASRFLYLTVEYVGESPHFFESGVPFLQHPSTSLSEYEQRISPLGSNLTSVEQFSPVYQSQVMEQSSTTADSVALYHPQIEETADVSSSPEQLVPSCQTMDSSNGVLTTTEFVEVVCKEELQNVGDLETRGGVQLLISDLDGSPLTLDDQQLGSVLSALKAEGLVLEDNSQQKLHNPVEVSQSSEVDTISDKDVDFADELITSHDEREQSVISSTSDQFYCDECGECFDDPSCHKHKVQSISDKPVLTRAWASLPASHLSIAKLSDDSPAGYGVFARKLIPKRTQFGPIEGILLDVNQKPIAENVLNLSIETDAGEFQYLDVSDENTSNWMRFVRYSEESNLTVSQHGKSLFFTTTSAIQPKQELLVWYSEAYAKRRGLPLPKGAEVELASWPCFECSETFTNSEDLQKHLNIHDRGEECQPKIRKSARVLRRRSLGHHKYKSTLEKKNSENYRFQCHCCNRTFPRNYSLKRHLQLHADQSAGRSNRNHRKCDRENVDQNGKTFALPCKQKLASNGGGWQCVHCNLAFDKASLLDLHTISHKPGSVILDSLKCPQCEQVHKDEKAFLEHVTGHGKVPASKSKGTNPSKPWKCDLCYKCFASSCRLEKHMLVHGAEETKPLQCDVCFKRFLNNSALACHLKIHTDEKKIFECPICKCVFEQVLALKEHVHIHSENGTFSCPQCCKVFDGYSLIRKHIRAFHSDRKHTCICCEKPFPTLDKLRMHMLRHSDHREFLCQNCGKQFKRKDKLKEHMKRMHSGDRESKQASAEKQSQSNSPGARKFSPKAQVSDYSRFIYKCHSCVVGFKRRGMLVNHLAKRHPDISPDSVPELNLPILRTTRDYFCQYCEKVYKSSSKRKAHILKIHPGAELPMSNRCKGGIPEIPGLPNPTFSKTVGSVTTHPHSCQWCHKQYASHAKLLQHQRKKHFELLPPGQQIPRAVRASTSSPPLVENKIQELRVENVISIVPGDYHITATDEELQELQDSGIIIDTNSLKKGPIKELRLSVPEHFLRVVASSTTAWPEASFSPYTER